MRQPHDDALLVDMLVYARRIASRVVTVTRPEFDTDEDLQFALVYLIQVVGEAASKVSQETRDAHASIPWRSIVGVRHVVVHDYLRVDNDVVWDTAANGMPDLITELESFVPPFEKRDDT